MTFRDAMSKYRINAVMTARTDPWYSSAHSFKTVYQNIM